VRDVEEVGTSRGTGFGEVLRPGSACAVLGGIAGHRLLAEREEQVSGALLAKLKQKADAAVRQDLMGQARSGTTVAASIGGFMKGAGIPMF
jgi:hypothetical protein